MIRWVLRLTVGLLALVGLVDSAAALVRYWPDFVEQLEYAQREADEGRSPFIRTW